MIELFFSLLIVLCYFASGLYALTHNKRTLLELTALMLLSLFVINSLWQVSVLFAFLLFLSLSQKLSYPSFVNYCMFPAIMLSFFFLRLFMGSGTQMMLGIAIVSVVAICALGIFGIFEDNLRRYLFISNAIQITFVVLDLAVGKMTGKLDVIGTVQIFNYTFAGLALFLSLGVLAHHRHRISELEGSYLRNRWNDIFATIACLSLAGLPAFNMFVSEWALFTAAFAVAPMIAVLGIFAALVLFIMYYKVVYVLLVGEGKQIPAPTSLTVLNGLLALSCIVLGLFPHIQWELLSKVI
jgi:formate hydrogenlyase subunit 3/multisubunit Na+/H+ antiporter MnhD subunit